MRRTKSAVQLDVSAVRAGLLCVLLGGCVPPYRPPTENEPHAVVKFRRTYEQVAGVSLREVVDIDEHRALEDTTAAGVAGAARTDATLVHPVPARVEVASEFFHTEMQQVQESYQVSTPHYGTESYDCSSGYGSNRSYRTCTRPQTTYTYETKYRTVTKAVEVSDGACRASVPFGPQAGHVYLFQYTYQDRGACHLACMEQITTGDGTFRSEPCPVVAPRD